MNQLNLSADVIVIGAGSVGSMAAWQLAKRGHRVVAIDRSTVPGPFSAYAGESRLFRSIYREGNHYGSLIARSYELWRELEAESGRELLEISGGVTIGRAGVPSFEQLLATAQNQEQAFELLEGAAARNRLPLHAISDDSIALFDPNSGYVRSEQAVLAAVLCARAAGATFLERRIVNGIERVGENWSVRTQSESVTAPRIIVATGTGAGPFCKSLGTHLSVLPQVLTWFPIRDPSAYRERRHRVFLRYEEGASFYGFPSSDGWSVKVAASLYLDEVPHYDHPIELHPHYVDAVTEYVRKYLPGLEPKPVRVAPCADGYISDNTALLGNVAGLEGVVSAVGLSGHGFKMAPALGSAAADLAINGETSLNIGFMSPNRFGSSVSPGDGLVNI